MKRILLIFALGLTTILAFAQQITEEEAKNRALLFIKSNKAPANIQHRAAAQNGKQMQLKSAHVDANRVYAFNLNGGGFVIASGDERTLPVLGYSTEGHFDWESLPENMRQWIKSYDAAIAALGNTKDFADGNALKNNRLYTSEDRAERQAVEPLITSHWSQSAPYYNQCPIYEGSDGSLQGKRCLTGCVATAMAQIMNYHKWPVTVSEDIPGYCPREEEWYIESLPSVTFDWDNILDDYEVLNPDTNQKEVVGTEEQQNAVATLMRYCGQSVEMMYGPNGSGAYTSDCAKAYRSYFGYPAATHLAERSLFSIDEWENIIYGELAANRPVLYCGHSDSGGHAFVCDGYDGDGLFHINWGWGGNADGYFSLSVLNPYTATSGEQGSKHLGYCMYQGATIYLDPQMQEPLNPYASKPEISTYSNISLYLNFLITNILINRSEAATLTADFALGTISKSGELSPYLPEKTNIELENGLVQFYTPFDSTEFHAGDSITLHPMIRWHDEEAQWKLIPPVSNYVVMGRRDDGIFFIDIHGEFDGLELIDGSITKGTALIGEKNDLTVRIKNLSDEDYIGYFSLVPTFYGHISPEEIPSATNYKTADPLETEGFLRAGQEGEVIFSFTPSQGGLVVFEVLNDVSRPIGSFILNLTNDTLTNYDKYVKNASYLSSVDGQWYYNVILRRTNVSDMPLWIPSDCLSLQIYFSQEGTVKDSVIIRNEVLDFLKPLPQCNSNYRFTYTMPIDIQPEGEYSVTSYLGVNHLGVISDTSCIHTHSFSGSAPTPVFAYTHENTTLYYILDDDDNAMVASPFYPNIYYNADSTICETWYGYDKPQGDVIIPETVMHNGTSHTVTCIGPRTFYKCDGVTSFQLPNTVVSIAANSFRECTNLKNIYIPEGDTIIGQGAFYKCTSLESITLPTHLRELRDYSFSYCSNLAEIHVPQGVTTLGTSVFNKCKNLKTATLPEGLTSLGYYTFSNCEQLTEIDFPSTLKSMEFECFRGSGITSVKLPEGFTTLPQSAFKECPNLQTVSLPGSLTTLSEEAFSSCKSLREVTIGQALQKGDEEEASTSNVLHSGLKAIGKNAFLDCSNLEKVTLPEGLKNIKNDAFRNCTSLKDINFPSTLSNIMDYAFSATALTSVTLPEGFTRLGNYTFEYCNSLESVSLPSTLKTVTNGAFADCHALQNVTLAEGIERLNYCSFLFDISLKSVVMPNSLKRIDSFVFYGCTGLTEVKLNEGLRLVDYASFYKCCALQDINFPTTLDSIGQAAFRYCSLLDSIYLPDQLTRIGMSAFEDTNIRYCHLPEQLEVVAPWMLYNTQLESIVLPPHVTHVEMQSLAGCPKLHKVTMPASVTYLGDSLFIDGTPLDTLIMECVTPPALGLGVFPEYTAKLFVPAGSLEAYQEHPIWGLFLNIYEIGATAISQLDNHPMEVHPMYDLQGRRITSKVEGTGIHLVLTDNPSGQKLLIK